MKKRKPKHGQRAVKRAPRPVNREKSAEVPEQRPRIGLEATVERVVEPQHTIQAVNPNLPAVFSTPSMIGLMEHATVIAVLPELPPGAITVGTRIEVDHLKAVGPGATVHAWARFVKYEGRFLVFDVEARSGEHLIGRGRVFRAIVDPARHGDKAQARVRR
ncbi:MAG TPA: hotdog domain-containing protein [Verrucomicrobiae bacterium]|nr:hotdog domain-containing protein [Verrucomicrobiae bacterium]